MRPVATIHVQREQHHLAWDRSPAPVAIEPSGPVIEIDAKRVMMGTDFPWYNIDYASTRIRKLRA